MVGVRVYETIRKFDVGELIELYKIDLTKQGGVIYYMTNNVMEERIAIRFGGLEYSYMPLMMDDIEIDAQGSPPQPRLSLATAGGPVTAIIEANNQLRGAEVTQFFTFAEFLDQKPGTVFVGGYPGNPTLSVINGGSTLNTVNGDFRTITDNSATTWLFATPTNTLTIQPNTSYVIGFRVKKDAIPKTTRYPLFRIGGGIFSANVEFQIDTSTGELSIGSAPAGLTFGVVDDNDCWLVYGIATTVTFAANYQWNTLEIYPAVGFGAAMNSGTWTAANTGSIDLKDFTIYAGSTPPTARVSQPGAVDNPLKDGTAIVQSELFIIDRLEGSDNREAQFLCVAPTDIEGAMLPRRIVRKRWCDAMYRVYKSSLGNFVNFDTADGGCPYRGNRYFDRYNNPTTIENDRCSKTMQGCLRRYGYQNAEGKYVSNVAMPTQMFPGVRATQEA